jgi:hypothetical protein
LKKQTNASTGKRSVVRRERDPEETRLLMKVIKKDIQRLQQEGILEINGRVWKFNI